MNAIAFGVKRAFHSFLRVTRKPLQSLSPGLTAARFDLLYLLWTERQNSCFRRGPTRQRVVQRQLGVSASVVSRMLKALERLGWVRRERSAGDGRQREVTLTDQGLACIREAHQALRRAVRKLVYRAICFGRHRDASARFEHMETLECYLRSMRRPWGDTASLYYPWGHPDD